jgi:hypothetical protein
MSEDRSRPVLQGLALIVIGLLFILGNFGVFHPDWEMVFALIIMVMGILFWAGFIGDRTREFLIMPGTILVIYGVVFLLIARYERATIESMGPLFILAPALGLYLTHLLSRKHRGILVTSAVLGVISLIFLLNSVHVFKYIWPFITAGLGVYIMMNPGKKPDVFPGGPGGHDQP